jgi:hypothetical protein
MSWTKDLLTRTGFYWVRFGPAATMLEDISAMPSPVSLSPAPGSC